MPDTIGNGNYAPYLAQAFTPSAFTPPAFTLQAFTPPRVNPLPFIAQQGAMAPGLSAMRA
jgi:hypothetical protein